MTEGRGSTCTIHGAQPELWCAECDKNADPNVVDARNINPTVASEGISPEVLAAARAILKAQGK